MIPYVCRITVNDKDINSVWANFYIQNGYDYEDSVCCCMDYVDYNSVLVYVNDKGKVSPYKIAELPRLVLGVIQVSSLDDNMHIYAFKMTYAEAYITYNIDRYWKDCKSESLSDFMSDSSYSLLPVYKCVGDNFAFYFEKSIKDGTFVTNYTTLAREILLGAILPVIDEEGSQSLHFMNYVCYEDRVYMAEFSLAKSDYEYAIGELG